MKSKGALRRTKMGHLSEVKGGSFGILKKVAAPAQTKHTHPCVSQTHEMFMCVWRSITPGITITYTLVFHLDHLDA